MDTEYKRWKDEQQARERMTRAVHPPATERTPRPIATSVGVPVLQALAIGCALALLAGGLSGLFGAGWLLAGKLAGAALLTGTGGAGLLFVWQERAVRTAPMRIAWRRLLLAEPTPPPPPDDDDTPWRVIRPYAAKAPLISATATRLDADIKPVEPDVRPEVKALHDFICANWGRNGTGNLSRDACKKRGWGRAKWERYVAGRRGKSGESARGILDRAGVVEKDTTGWRWKDGVTLADVFAITDELNAYADARAKMVSGRTGRTGRDGDATTSRRPEER